MRNVDYKNYNEHLCLKHCADLHTLSNTFNKPLIFYYDLHFTNEGTECQRN